MAGAAQAEADVVADEPELDAVRSTPGRPAAQAGVRGRDPADHREQDERGQPRARRRAGGDRRR